MRTRVWWIILLVIVVLVLAGAAIVTNFNLSAVQDPGSLETSMANRGRHFLVKRSSRHGIPQRPVDKKASIAQGDMLYGIDCSMCHGHDGRTATDMGRWMYPRAADLGSEEVQSYSDAELFWIIKNGIRLSGMPAFGKVESDQHIWNLTDFVRTIPQQHPTQSQAAR